MVENLPRCLLLMLSINACLLILLTIFLKLFTNRSSSQRVSASTTSMSNSISSPSNFKSLFLLIIYTTCSIFSDNKLCNPNPNLCFSSRLISILLGSLAFSFGCFKGFTGEASIGDAGRTGDCTNGLLSLWLWLL